MDFQPLAKPRDGSSSAQLQKRREKVLSLPLTHKTPREALKRPSESLHDP